MSQTPNGPMMSLDRIDAAMRAVFEELAGRPDCTGRSRDVLAAVAKKIALTDTELASNASGIPRWEFNVSFYTTDCSRAEFLRKQRGTWTLTEKGREALRLPPGQLIRTASRLYRAWKAQRDAGNGAVAMLNTPDIDLAPPEAEATPRESALLNAAYNRAKEDAVQSIEAHIAKLGPYELQDLAEYLLTAMGYHVAFNAPRGPDGGVDLIVYKDPLGTVTPRIKVQVKHRPNLKASVNEVRELQGLLQHQEEVGLLVSTGGFTNDAARAARSAGKHVDMIDLPRLVELWVKHYDRIDAEGRAMLPIAPIYFLAPSED